MNESVLNSIKHLIGGIEPEYTHFDNDLILHINSALSVLYQLGVGTKASAILSANDTWADILEDDRNLALVKSWLYLKVQLLFDRPQNSFTIDAIQKQINELEWRINTQVEDMEGVYEHVGYDTKRKS